MLMELQPLKKSQLTRTIIVDFRDGNPEAHAFGTGAQSIESFHLPACIEKSPLPVWVERTTRLQIHHGNLPFETPIFEYHEIPWS